MPPSNELKKPNRTSRIAPRCAYRTPLGELRSSDVQSKSTTPYQHTASDQTAAAESGIASTQSMSHEVNSPIGVQ